MLSVQLLVDHTVAIPIVTRQAFDDAVETDGAFKGRCGRLVAPGFMSSDLRLNTAFEKWVSVPKRQTTTWIGGDGFSVIFETQRARRATKRATKHRIRKWDLGSGATSNFVDRLRQLQRHFLKRKDREDRYGHRKETIQEVIATGVE